MTRMDLRRRPPTASVRTVAYVPDAGHSYAIRAAFDDPTIEDVVLTTEDEGVGVVSGAWLGGQLAILLMQSPDVGNCVNMFSLLEMCRFPFLTRLTVRGEYPEFNPWQIPMGSTTQQILELMGIPDSGRRPRPRSTMSSLQPSTKPSHW